MFLLLLAGASSANAQATLSIRDFQINQGEIKTISIDMTNSIEVRAFQVQVILPANVKLASSPTVVHERQGSAVNESGEVIASSKTLSYNQCEDGSLIIVVNANDAVPFSGTEGAVLDLPLVAAENAPIGTATIELQNMELVFADGHTYVRPENNSCHVDIHEKITTIKQLEQIVQGSVDVYSVNGMLVKRNVPIKKLGKRLPRGIYVIEGHKVAVEPTL